MKKENLEKAIREAKRFQTIAKEALEAINRNHTILYGPSKLVSATKRASMDLTRALTEMRKP